MAKFRGDILKYSGLHHFKLYRYDGSESKVNIVPESPDWFHWLAHVSSFVYMGSAYIHEARKELQDGREYWYAYRNIRGNRIKRYLGSSRELTIVRLEQAALEFKQIAFEFKQTGPAFDFKKNIFISYSRTEFYFAESLSHELNARGVGTWFDVVQLVPGTSWQQELQEGLGTCQGLVLIASRAALKSAYVRDEWEAALAAHKPIYVVLCEAVRLPPELQTAQILDFRDSFDAKVAQLASLIIKGNEPRNWLPRDTSFLRRRLPPTGARAVIWALWIQILTFVMLTSLLKMIGYISLVRPAALPAAIMFGLAWLTCRGYTCYLLVGFTYRRRISYTALSIWLVVPPLLIFPFLYVLLNLETALDFFGIGIVIAPPEAGWQVLGHEWDFFVFYFSSFYFAIGLVFFLLTRSKEIVRWLATGTAPEKLRSPLQQVYRGEASDKAVKTYRLHYAPPDERLVSQVRAVLGTGEGLKLSFEEQADFHIAVLTNQTSQEWLEQLVHAYPNLICIVATSIRLPTEERLVRQLQWTDYRSGSSASLERLVFFLTKGKVGMWAMMHPVVPESLERLVVPRQVWVMSRMLMILAMFNLAVGGATAIALARQGSGHAALGTWPIAGVLVAGVLFWLANRLVYRRIPFIILLVTVIVALASMLLLGIVQELFDGFDGFGLLPWMGILLGIGLLISPLLLLLLFHRGLQEWLPMAGRWRVAKQRRQTLALPTWQRLVQNSGLYVLGSLGLQALIFTNIALVLPKPLLAVPARLTYTVTEFPIGSSNLDGILGGITAGPDGNLWFTSTASFADTVKMAIGRITPSGSITEFAYTPSKSWDTNSILVGITAGPDGNLWFTENERDSSAIGRITPAGAITEFRLPDARIAPTDITAGSDGNLWCIEDNVSKIGRIGPTGTITEFPIRPIGDSELKGITAGPDGNLWFMGSGSNVLGKIQS